MADRDAPPDRYHLTYLPGLCRHGCGEPLARPQNRFINGHDGKLMDLLVDAYREGECLLLRTPGQAGRPGVVVTPREWAMQAFSPAGLAHFDSLIHHHSEDTSWQEPVSGSSVSELSADLATVREIVARAATGATDAEVAAVERIRDLEEIARTEHARVLELEAFLAVAAAPVTVNADEIASLDSGQVLAAVRLRARRTAEVLDAANYRGDSGEVWDLVSVFRHQNDPVIERAARTFLGQEL